MTTGDETIIVWHRTDLRIEDNPALERAAALARAEEATIQPVFVFDPRFYGAESLACDGRVTFLHECLSSLREQYREHGSELAFLHGTPADRLAGLLDASDTDSTHLCYTRHLRACPRNIDREIRFHGF